MDGLMMVPARRTGLEGALLDAKERSSIVKALFLMFVGGRKARDLSYLLVSLLYNELIEAVNIEAAKADFTDGIYNATLPPTHKLLQQTSLHSHQPHNLSRIVSCALPSSSKGN